MNIIPRQYRDIEPIGWQRQFMEMLSVGDDSDFIDVLYDPNGCTGKTYLDFMCEHRMNAISMPPDNNAKRIVRVAFDSMKMHDVSQPSAFIFDLPRATEFDKLGGLFQAARILKSGTCRRGQQEMHFEKPHVWIFMSQLPSDIASQGVRIWTNENAMFDSVKNPNYNKRNIYRVRPDSTLKLHTR
jgi:hypothetical protein